ncbi:MAG: LLM class flavin-dependent oxidoreductase [Deltaproteobacteria bacterium]|nr:LLM class flavin-dependent oxidoreductase [Deltaproteobacteria bacterium]
MLAYHFTEMPYPFVPEEAEERHGSLRVVLPNQYFDPKIGHELYNRYLDEYEYADELGLEIMLNEHHQTATCIDANCAISAAALIRRTRRAKILLLGNPLPHRDNPLRVAEEVAMLDVISGGRIICGFVRGVGPEIHPANTNPAQTRERFAEAHDLIIKAWTTQDVFNWEGKHFHFRYANPWPRPYQQPHPPIWITGSSVENVPWVADHQYTFATFLTPWEVTESLFNAYRARCREMGYPEPGPEKFAYLAMCYVGETDERAQEEGRKLLWYLHRRRPAGFFSPPGYVPPRVLARAYLRGTGHTRSWEQLEADGVVICGSPRTVLKKVVSMYERVGVGHFLMMNQAGFMTAQETRRSMELFAREVYPEIRHLGEP